LPRSVSVRSPLPESKIFPIDADGSLFLPRDVRVCPRGPDVARRGERRPTPSANRLNYWSKPFLAMRNARHPPLHRSHRGGRLFSAGFCGNSRNRSVEFASLSPRWIMPCRLRLGSHLVSRLHGLQEVPLFSPRLVNHSPFALSSLLPLAKVFVPPDTTAQSEEPLECPPDQDL